MKQTSTTAFLLTFLVALLVLVAAVVFLARDNQVLESQTAGLATEQAIMSTTNEQLSTESTLQARAAETDEMNLLATRDMLATDLAAQMERVDALSTQATQQAVNAAEAESAANQPEIQFFTSLQDTTVLPNTNVELFVTVFANNGIDGVEVTVNDTPWESRPGVGEPTAVYNFEWMTEEEETVVFRAIATDMTGQISKPKTLTITVAYPSEEARLEALQQEVAESVSEIRITETAADPATGPEPGQPQTETAEPDLHQQLLFGSDSYSEVEAQRDELIYRAFRLIPDDFDLLAYTTGNLTEQTVLGAYNPDSQTVAAYNPILGEQNAFNRWLTAHTTTHDLQREEFGLDQINILGQETDYRLALRAMVEGEANFVQYNYLQDEEAFTPEERVSVTDALNQQALSIFNETPLFLREQFEFAYRYGFQFIQFLFEQGGFELVNNIWTDQPDSSEQILHPESYLRGDTPSTVTIPSLTDVLDGDWQRVHEDTLGEFYLRQHLSRFVSENVDQAASGWGGDRYILYWNAAGDQLVMALRLAWDDPAVDSDEFTSAYINYLRNAYQSEPELQEDGGRCAQQGEDVTCLYQFELETFVVRAPDLETAATVAAQVQ